MCGDAKHLQRNLACTKVLNGDLESDSLGRRRNVAVFLSRSLVFPSWWVWLDLQKRIYARLIRKCIFCISTRLISMHLGRSRDGDQKHGCRDQKLWDWDQSKIGLETLTSLFDESDDNFQLITIWRMLHWDMSDVWHLMWIILGFISSLVIDRHWDMSDVWHLMWLTCRTSI